MSVLFKPVEIEQLAVTPGGTIYTCPSNTTAQVLQGNCTNESSSAASFTIHVIKSGGSLADTNIYTDAQNIPPNDFDLVTGLVGMILEGGDFIVAFGSAGSSMNLKLSIKEIA